MTPHREAVVALPTLDELAAYVHAELCRFDSLDAAQTPLHRGSVKRAGRPAAVLFHVEGPRLLRTSAVWSIDEGPHPVLRLDGQPREGGAAERVAGGQGGLVS